eukprot:COSAG02_NODE_13966_length_1326_cov_1.089650_3_plen_74_part_00
MAIHYWTPIDSSEHGLEVSAWSRYHIVIDPFFHSMGPGFCSLETTLPGLVDVQLSPSSVLLETTIGPLPAEIE